MISLANYGTHDESAYPELWEGCVGAWAPCLGPTGTRLHDNSGRSNWGELTNMDAATDWVVDGGRYALDFDGSNDRVDSGPNAGFNIGTGDFSFSCWARWPSYDGSPRIVIRFAWTFGAGGNSDTGAGIYMTGTTIRGHFRDASGTIREVVAALPSAGVWHCFVVTRQSQVVSFYIDGVLIGTTAGANSDYQTHVRTRIGANSAASPVFYYNGLIDDIRCYRRALDTKTISIMSQSRGIAYTPSRRTRSYFIGQSFNAAWARGANQFIQPSTIGVA